MCLVEMDQTMINCSHHPLLLSRHPEEEGWWSRGWSLLGRRDKIIIIFILIIRTWNDRFFYDSFKFASLINLIERSATLSPCKLISAKDLRSLFLQLKLNNS